MSGTTILNCGCGKDRPTPAQDYQDKAYGKGRRVCNYSMKSTAKCTCCGTVHRVEDAPKPKKK